MQKSSYWIQENAYQVLERHLTGEEPERKAIVIRFVNVAVSWSPARH